MQKRDWAKDWELCEKATLGPWYAIPHPEYTSASWRVDTNPNASWAGFGQLAYMSGENARFVAEARDALPYWLQRVRELEKERDELRADIAFLMQEYGESNEPMSKDAVELKERCRVLKERDELRARVEELERQLEIAAREITKAHKGYDMCPSDYDGELNCVCEEATIADVWQCWRARWRLKALDDEHIVKTGGIRRSGGGNEST